jgi:hypothetical protein
MKKQNTVFTSFSVSSEPVLSKDSQCFFSQLHKKAIFYGLVDEGGWFPQMLASRKTTAEYTKLTKTTLRLQRNLRPKICVNPCSSVVNFSSCLRVFVAETQSIKNNKLCKTNPISKTSKWL